MNDQIAGDLTGQELAAENTGNGTDRGIGAVRSRREELLAAMRTLEVANASPAASHWRERMTAALDGMTAMLRRHVAETEGPGGFLQRVVFDEPRVGYLVQRLRNEHVQLQRRLGEIVARCADPGCSAADLRAEVSGLLDLLHRHRHAGADLLYEAYEVDVAFGD